MTAEGTAQGTTSGTTKVTVLTLTAMVVGSMVGAGVFSLPRRFAQETGVAGALVAWVVAGAGMFTLALVFQRLAVRKPGLDAGVYAYAKAGFGEFTGFYAAAGYWASACVGNVTYWVLIMSTLGAWVPALGAGDTVLALVLSSVGLWLFFALVRQGIREATAINRIVTIAKLVPILVFVLLAVLGVRPRVYSRHARRREDVGRATILGFTSVLAIFASVTIVSYGILPMAEIAELRQPSMAGVLEAAVGPWGSVFVDVGLIVSVLGAYLAWTLMAAEVLFVAAKDRDMPRFLTRTRREDVPVNALLLSTALSQVVLVVTYFSDDAFDFALDLTASMTLIPFLLAALYALRLRLTRETYDGAPARTLTGDLVVAVLASAYTAFLLFAAGLDLALLAFVFYAPVTVLFVMTRREQGRRAFGPAELALLGVVVALAVLAVAGLAAGWVSL